ncbi:hypothetical protein HanPI659440_Chr06g0234401 [Helianthus annuus]|nr:hypothetical protein HanPI659440_Chr06g0234401 [Helianthus annuus]
MTVALCSGARFVGRRRTEVAPNKSGLTDLIHHLLGPSLSLNWFVHIYIQETGVITSKPYQKVFQNKIQSVVIKENILVGSLFVNKKVIFVFKS